jgi:hypothetical protein
MENWTRVIDAGRELAQAFDLLDRAEEIVTISAAAVLAKQTMLDAACRAVARANALLGRA